MVSFCAKSVGRTYWVSVLKSDLQWEISHVLSKSLNSGSNLSQYLEQILTKKKKQKNFVSPTWALIIWDTGMRTRKKTLLYLNKSSMKQTVCARTSVIFPWGGETFRRLIHVGHCWGVTSVCDSMNLTYCTVCVCGRKRKAHGSTGMGVNTVWLVNMIRLINLYVLGKLDRHKACKC